MTSTHPTPLDLATCVEHSLHLSLDRFDLSAARLYGITVVDPEGIPAKADGSLRITFLAEHADVYELLDAPTSAISKMFDAAVVLTCGWAAPLDDDDEPSDLAPSRHPRRRRVRLVVTVCDLGVASVLRFADTPEEIVTDDGAARGTLADAVNSLWFTSSVDANAS